MSQQRHPQMQGASGASLGLFGKQQQQQQQQKRATTAGGNKRRNKRKRKKQRPATATTTMEVPTTMHPPTLGIPSDRVLLRKARQSRPPTAPTAPTLPTTAEEEVQAARPTKLNHGSHTSQGYARNRQRKRGLDAVISAHREYDKKGMTTTTPMTISM